jgi:hypothetical protein
VKMLESIFDEKWSDKEYGKKLKALKCIFNKVRRETDKTYKENEQNFEQKVEIKRFFQEVDGLFERVDKLILSRRLNFLQCSTKNHPSIKKFRS